MSLNADYQKLESGNDVRLIEVDGSSFGLTDVLRFHNYNIPHTEAEIVAAGGDEAKLPAKPIWWQGNEYSAWPYQLEGLEKSTSGSNATPSLTVADIESAIAALCLAYDDLLQAKVTIHDTKANISMRKTSQAVTLQQIRLRRKFRSGISTGKRPSLPAKPLSLYCPALWIFRDK